MTKDRGRSDKTLRWDIEVNEARRYARVVTEGVAEREGSLAMVKDLAAALRGTDIRRVLIDHTHIQDVSGTTVDVFARPRELAELGVGREIRVAEVVRSEHREFFDFLETVCVNRGYTFAMFADEESALQWLLEP